MDRAPRDAEALRAEFFDIFIWAFRDGSRDADLKRIREGDGVADPVADLGDLVEIAGPQALGNPACELAEARSVGAR